MLYCTERKKAVGILSYFFSLWSWILFLYLAVSLGWNKVLWKSPDEVNQKGKNNYSGNFKPLLKQLKCHVAKDNVPNTTEFSSG